MSALLRTARDRYAGKARDGFRRTNEKQFFLDGQF